MASRLSEDSLLSVYDVGHRSVNLVEEGQANSDLMSELDLDAIMMKPDAKEIIQNKSALEVYRGLMRGDSERSIEVLELITQEQFTGILDFDAWRDDRLVPKQVFRWLRLYGEIGTKELYERFSRLEEEYQLAVVGPYINYYDDEEYERMPQEMQDRLTALPGADSYYEILSNDKDIYTGIENLIEASMAHHMSYAISLLTHSAFMPPAEQEALLARFRTARIEEEGYVSYDESLTAFIGLDVDVKLKKWSEKSSSLPVVNHEIEPPFLERVFSYGLNQSSDNRWDEKQVVELKQKLMFLANNLCAASRIEADDDQSLKMILRHAHALSGVALEVLSKGDLRLAAAILVEEHPKELFRTGLSIVAKAQHRILDLLEKAGLRNVYSVRQSIQMGKFGAAVNFIEEQWLDQLGLLRVEILKAVFNRYPAKPVMESTYFSDHASKVYFAPIDSVASLRQMLSDLDGQFAALAFFPENSLENLTVSMDAVMTNMVFNAITKGEFSNSKIGEQEVKAFLDKTSDEIEISADQFLEDTCSQLKTIDMHQWSLFFGCEHLVGSDVEQSAEKFAHELSNTVTTLQNLWRESKKENTDLVSAFLIGNSAKH